jgi:hypothetical protein
LEGEIMTIVTVGIDLAKNVFAVHGVDATGRPVMLKLSVPRAKLAELIASLPPCLIGMKACSGAHHWARLFATFGHTVRTLRAGTSLHLTQSPLPDLPADVMDKQGHAPEHPVRHPGFHVIRVAHLGINNLPKPATASLAELFGHVPELLGEVLQSLQAPSKRLGIPY